MIAQRISKRCLSVTLTLSILWLMIPASVAADTATLSGSNVLAANREPLVGARLHAADSRTGRVYSSEPAGLQGEFVVRELPASTYELAVESGGGLFVVQTPLQVAPGASLPVNLTVTPQPMSAKKDDAKDKGSILRNPLFATLASLGVATIIGLVLQDQIDTADASPSQP